MLPKNTIGRQMLKKLHVVPGPEHPHQAQSPVALALGERPAWDGLPAKPAPEAPKSTAKPAAKPKATAAKPKASTAQPKSATKAKTTAAKPKAKSATKASAAKPKAKSATKSTSKAKPAAKKKTETEE